MKHAIRTPSRPGSHTALRRGLLLAAAALLALLWVWMVNGRVLYYFDTASYIDVGERIIERVLPSPAIDPAAAAPHDAAQGAKSGSVNAARSLVYALIVGAFAHLGFLDGVVLTQALLTLLVAWVAARIVLRGQANPDPAGLAFLPVLLCAFTALPFYVAYLMPDQMAPLGILAVALIAAFARRMTRIELLLFWAVAALSAMVHLSNLAILALLVPVTALVSLLIGRTRWWLAPLLSGTAVMAGLLPVLLLTALASHVPPGKSGGAEEDGTGAGGSRTVTFTPFITARLIVDGPGMTFLEQHCPDPQIATCRLYEALGWSDDPWRITTSHIVFSTDPRLGSYALLPEADQLAIAAEQKRFFLAVLKAYPVGVTTAILHNALLQTVTTSVDMTIPSPKVAIAVQKLLPQPLPEFEPGRLADTGTWIGVADTVHGSLYALSALALAFLLVWPDPRLDRRVRLFAAMVIAGLLANALVCGGVSQPASRYGGRTAWLLPYLAMFLLVLRARRTPQPPAAAV